MSIHCANGHSKGKDIYVASIGRENCGVNRNDVKNELSRLNHENELVIFDDHENIPVTSHQKYPLVALHECLITSTASVESFLKTEKGINVCNLILAGEMPMKYHIIIDGLSDDEVNNRCLQDANRHKGPTFRANGHSKGKDICVASIVKENGDVNRHEDEIGRLKHEPELVIFDNHENIPVATYGKYPLVALRDCLTTRTAAVAPMPKTEKDTVKECRRHEFSLCLSKKIPFVKLVDCMKTYGDKANQKSSSAMSQRNGLVCEYECYICKQVFVNAESLSKHLMESHPSKSVHRKNLIRNQMNVRTDSIERPYACKHPQCHRKYKSKYDLALHVITHSGKKTHLCTYLNCNGAFFTARALNIHSRIHTYRESKYVCAHGQCGKKFRTRGALRVHSLRHDPDAKRYVCKYVNCDKAFTRNDKMNRHYLTHEKNRPRPYMCPFPQCGKSYAERETLKIHSIAHKTDRPFACDQCDKTFTWKKSLQCHKRTHSDTRPFPCDHEECGKSFKTTGELKVHKLYHSEQRLYACTHPDCDKKFKTGGLLSFHRRVHWSDKPFFCECGKGFKSKSNLQRHHSQTHLGETPYKCT